MTENRVASSYVRLLYEYIERQGRDPVDVLGEPLDESAHFVPMARWQTMLARVDALERRPALALRIAEGIGARHFGVVGYAALACGNLAESQRATGTESRCGTGQLTEQVLVTFESHGVAEHTASRSFHIFLVVADKFIGENDFATNL